MRARTLKYLTRWPVWLVVGKLAKCKECRAITFGGRPGMYAAQCIPHLPSCSQYPSPGQLQEAEVADRARAADLATATAQRLVSLGYLSALAQFGTVVLSADDAARMLEAKS